MLNTGDKDHIVRYGLVTNLGILLNIYKNN